MKYLIAVILMLFLSACDRHADEATSNNDSSDSVPAFLKQPLQGKVSQHGLYRMVRNSGVMDDANTTTGKVVANPVIERVKTTSRIPLIKGAQMYLQYRLWPFPNQPGYVTLRRVLKHPPMTLPDGRVTTGSDFEVKRKVSSNHVIVYTGYGFDEDYELVEGEWVFQIWYGEKKLIEQKFTTYRPDAHEVAVLKPMLELGDRVQTTMMSPQKKNKRLNWPRVVVGANENKTPAGVKETIRMMEQPIVTP